MFFFREGLNRLTRRQQKERRQPRSCRHVSACGMLENQRSVRFRRLLPSPKMGILRARVLRLTRGKAAFLFVCLCFQAFALRSSSRYSLTRSCKISVCEKSRLYTMFLSRGILIMPTEYRKFIHNSLGYFTSFIQKIRILWILDL